MRKEQVFASACIKAFFGNGEPAKLKRLFAQMDLKRFNDFVAKHNIQGFFYYLCSNHLLDPIDFPPDTIKQWKMVAGRNAMVNQINDTEAFRLADRFAAQSIDYVYIKGLSIRKKCYSQDYVKHSTDIDLFIHKKDYPKVKQLLFSEGYQIPYKHYTHDFGVTIPFDEYEKRAYEISFVKKKGAIKLAIDLQWDFTFQDTDAFLNTMYGLDSFYSFDSTAHTQMGAKSLKVFIPEVELINISFHYAFGHGFKGMQWLIDICTFLGKYRKSLDFDYILEHANQNLRKVIGICIMLAGYYHGWPKLEKAQSKQYCVDRLLPLECRLYKKMALRPVTNTVLDKLYLRLVKVLLPYALWDRLRVIRYLFFNTDSIRHRLHAGKKPNRFLLPFSLLKLMVTDLVRRRR